MWICGLRIEDFLGLRIEGGVGGRREGNKGTKGELHTHMNLLNSQNIHNHSIARVL
jgi:hypothetical protein